MSVESTEGQADLLEKRPAAGLVRWAGMMPAPYRAGHAAAKLMTSFAHHPTVTAKFHTA